MPVATKRPVIDDEALGRLLDRVEKPGRYIGNELHQVLKDPATVRGHLCLAFPDSYEIGMSHLGLKILYTHLNKVADLYVERAYCPFPDMEGQLRNAGVPLYSLETRTALSDFDVVGFSLQSEMTITNVLTMLDLGGVAIRREDRGEDAPLVIAGGPVVFNPEPSTDFFDAYLIGDGEEALAKFLSVDADLRAKGLGRRDRLAHLAREVDGIYAPALYDVAPHAETGFLHVQPHGDAPYPVYKALVDDVNAYPFPAETLVPQGEIIHDRVAVEIARGCTEGCRFCQAGIIYRPVRERTPESIVDTIVEGIDKTGFDEASLTALSTADFSCVTPLAKAVMAELQTRRSAMSVSSLRVYGVTEELAREIAKVRKTGFTIAPEAGSQRMRDVINKGVTDENIDTAAEIAFSNGWNRIKMYFMVGLPTETDEDVLGIAKIAKRVLAIGQRLGPRGIKVVVSVSSLVPKASSTFQWVRFDGVEELERKQAMLRQALGGVRQIDLKMHHTRVSRLEAILSRGDRRLGRVIEHAWNQGARFDEWTDYFDENRWNKALDACGVEPEPFIAEQPTEEPLIWDHIHPRVDKEFLLKDLKWGLKSRFMHPCEKPYLPKRHDPPRDADGIVKLVCYSCGVECDLKAIAIERERSGVAAEKIAEEKLEKLAGVDPATLPIRAVREAGEFQTVESAVPERNVDTGGNQPFEPTPGPLFKYRVCYAKTGLSRYLSHLELTRLIDRAGNRIKWPVAFTGGFHPHPKMSFGPALSTGVSGEREYFDVELSEEWAPSELAVKLQGTVHEGIVIHNAVQIAADTPKIDALIERIDYRIQFPTETLNALADSADGFRDRLTAKLGDEPWMIERITKRKRRRFDVRPMVASSDFVHMNGTVDWLLTIVPSDSRWVKPRELIESMLGDFPLGTRITRLAMGRVVDGELVAPLG